MLLKLSRLYLIFNFIIGKIEHSVVTGGTKGIIGSLFCSCHLASYH